MFPVRLLDANDVTGLPSSRRDSFAWRSTVYNIFMQGFFAVNFPKIPVVEPCVGSSPYLAQSLGPWTSWTLPNYLVVDVLVNFREFFEFGDFLRS